MTGMTSASGSSGGAPPRFAVAFRTHFWDDFTERQLERLKPYLGSGELFILADETRGKIPGLDHQRVFGVTDQQILDAGYVRAGEGSIQWFSGDVPMYLFRQAHPEYDVYVQLEYDVNVSVDLEDLCRRVAAEGVEMVDLPNPEPLEEWPWLPTCLDFYGREEVRHSLVCFSLFSGRALDLLARERLRQAEAFRAEPGVEWPYCEGYLPTEARRQGVRSASLAEYGDVSRYRWWPPYSERELTTAPDRSFVHPTLDTERYVASYLKRHPAYKLSDLVHPHGWINRRFQALGGREYLKALRHPAFVGHVRKAARWSATWRLGLHKTRG